MPYHALLDAGVKFYASLGNHDNPDERLYKPFNMGGQRYYTFNKGDVEFFVLDSNYMLAKSVQSGTLPPERTYTDVRSFPAISGLMTSSKKRRSV